MKLHPTKTATILAWLSVLWLLAAVPIVIVAAMSWDSNPPWYVLPAVLVVAFGFTVTTLWASAAAIRRRKEPGEDVLVAISCTAVTLLIHLPGLLGAAWRLLAD